MVEMGTDRMHHGFWKDMDPSTASTCRAAPTRTRSSTTTGTSTGSSARLLRHADDDTAVLVVSDHGAKRMDGGMRVNEWLRREGLLATLARARRGARARATSASTGRARRPGARAATTRASSSTCAGREPEGTSRPRTTSASATSSPSAAGRDPGRPRASRSATQVFRPEDVYDEIKGVAPDLIVHFGDLAGAPSARSAATTASTRSRTTRAPTTRTTPRTAC